MYIHKESGKVTPFIPFIYNFLFNQKLLILVPYFLRREPSNTLESIEESFRWVSLITFIMLYALRT